MAHFLSLYEHLCIPACDGIKPLNAYDFTKKLFEKTAFIIAKLEITDPKLYEEIASMSTPMISKNGKPSDIVPNFFKRGELMTYEQLTKVLTLQDIKIGDTLRVIRNHQLILTPTEKGDVQFTTTTVKFPLSAPLEEIITVAGYGCFNGRLYGIPEADALGVIDWVVSEKDGRPYCTPLSWCERYYKAYTIPEVQKIPNRHIIGEWKPETLNKVNKAWKEYWSGIDEGGRETDCSADNAFPTKRQIAIAETVLRRGGTLEEAEKVANIKLDNEIESKVECTCDIMVLMQSGCKCSALEKEKQLKGE